MAKKQWLAWDGETRNLIIVPSATDEDDARSQAAGADSDGDSLSLIEVPTTGNPVNATEILGIV